MQNKELTQVSRKKQAHYSTDKWLEQLFQEQMANKYLKKFATLLITRETLVLSFHTFNMIVFKKTKQQADNNKYCFLTLTMWKI